VRLQPLFSPRNLAVIGVSLSNHHHPANVIYTKNQLRYPVGVYAVNPKGGRLHGDPVYPNVKDIPDTVDLALIAVKAEQVQQSVSDCLEAGVQGAVIISGGFAESGRKDLQDDMAALAARHDFPVIGPNCLGLYAPGRVDTFFLPSERMIRPEPGNVAFVSQSGGVLVDQLVKFSQQGIGLSLAVSIGNKALLGELELLEHLAQDPATGVIALYLEGFKRSEGRAFVRAAADCGKPVVVLKAGKSSGGNRAVSSHTASLAGDYRVFSQVMAQFGIAEATSEFELLSFCESLSCYSGTIHGRLGIVTGSGGHGALCVDACENHSLEVPRLERENRERIRQSLSPSIQGIASLDNPIDLTGSAVDADFIAAVTEMAAFPDLDCLLVLLLPYLPGISSDLAARLSQISRNSGKPVIAYVPHVEKFGMFIEGFEYNRIPVASSIEGAVLMAEALRRCKTTC